MSKEMNKKTGLTKLEKENLGSVNGGYTIEVFVDGTVEVRGFQRQRMTRAERRAIRRGEAAMRPLQRVTRRFDNLPQAVLWAHHNLFPNQVPPQPINLPPVPPRQDRN